MARRTPTIAAALAVSAALLLTACGGSSNDASKDKIKGADESTKNPSASASTSAAPGAARPEIKLPASFEMNFENWTNSDAEKQAVMNDGKERLRAVHAAIVNNDPSSGSLAFYSSSSALSTGQTYVKGYTSKNLTLIGKATITNPVVTFLSKKRATLFYCMDESKGYTKDRKTGETQGTPKSINPHELYMTSVAKTEAGVWKTMTVETKRGGC
ncbi:MULTISPECIES: hypothetical protein [unclassified Streptomyces]|uniref:hypothetical protein n=1 Tax=unclassified Streptomyces TaxID=2593676 RepID=UPI002E1CD3F0|nr:hypothetical protein OG217_15700 [Streptomyces sp. NBC_01023]